jgi:mRNA interferase MazF
LVLTRDRAISVLNGVIVAPATRTIRGIPTEVPLGPSDGMPEACALTMDNVQVVSKRSLAERICTLGSVRMLEACRALRTAVDC